jgi:hypothetical protein
MGRLPDGELSQSSRAIKWRANKQLRNAAIALERQGATELIITPPKPKANFLIVGGERVMPPKSKKTKPNSDAIGVFTDPEPVETEAQSDRTYHCMNCRATVHQGDEACGVCEQRLNWEGI